MKFGKSILTATGAVVLAGLILALLAPRAVHAVVATAVLVMNTSANPVPNKDADQPGRHPYTSGCSQGYATSSAADCRFNTPLGSELVIQGVYLELLPNGGTTKPTHFLVTAQTGGNTGIYEVAAMTTPDGFGYDGVITTPLYADPGSVFTCEGESAVGGKFFPMPTISCTVSGYLVSLP
jgi:hypothetical protein